MLRAGGESKRRELISQFEEMSLSEKQVDYTEEEAKIARDGEKGQAEYLTKFKQQQQQRR